MPVTLTPSFALLTGSNYLKRTAADAYYTTNGFDELSVSVCIDPELVWSAGQSGTIISKHRTDNNQRQFRVTYNAANGLITVALWSNIASGTAACSRVTSVGLLTRGVFTFVFNGASLDLYINGVLRNGTLTGSVPATLGTNNEPLAIGAEETTGTPSNLWRGAVYMVALWNIALSGAEVATILTDGLIPAALEGGAYAPQIVCEHTNITQGASDKRVTGWNDLTGNLFHLTPDAVSGGLPFAQLAGGSLLLLSSYWNDSLLDQGNVGLGEGLSSTYTPAPPFQLWGPSDAPPTRASYRDGKHDFTMLIRARRIAGTLETLYLQLYGVELRYQSSSLEMFAIVGVDTTLTNQNVKVSYGIGIFPVEGLTVDIVVRFNAEEDDLDLFIGPVQYAKTPTASDSYYDGTTLTMSDEADFSVAALVPMVLPDAQVVTLLSQFKHVASSPLPFNVTKPGLFEPDHITDYVPDDAAIPAAVAPFNVSAALLLPLGTPFAAPTAGFPVPGLTPDVYAPAIPVPTALIDPLPVAISVTVDPLHEVTVIGEAGITDTNTIHWWEVETGPPTSDVSAVSLRYYTELFFLSRATDIRSFFIPSGMQWNGKRIRMVVMATEDPAQVWYSNWLTMTGDDFNNGGGAAMNYVIPVPVINTVSVNPATHEMFMDGTVGIITSDVIPNPPVDVWWEVEMSPGEFFAVVDQRLVASVPAPASIVDAFVIPFQTNFRGKYLQLVVRGTYSGQVVKSLPFFMADAGYDHGKFTPQPLPPGPGGFPAEVPAQGLGDIGVRIRRTLDFTTRR
jgi:hypothetical protein